MVRNVMVRVVLLVSFQLAGCGDDTEGQQQSPIDAGDSGTPNTQSELTLRADITPVTSIGDAQDGVFIPPFDHCDDAGCTHVAISGCAEEGEKFADHADCDVVRTQRPFWPRPPAGQSDPDDPRLEDDAYLEELAWVTSQVESAACVCCHDSDLVGGQAGIWDIRLGPLWLDSLSDAGLALFIGLADSSVLGAYPKDDNHGFDRTQTGLPTTDTERMQAFLRDEMEHRGLTEDELRAVPPFGGPIYANSVAIPEPCENGEGVDDAGKVHWSGGPARYVYVLEEGSKNPGVPPNLDSPDGTLWKLDVLASHAAVASGLRYGTTPDGSFQAIPETKRAPALEEGTTYHLVALLDVGLPVTSCLFTYGETTGGGEPDGGFADPSACQGDSTFGTACTEDSACTCEAASYCAVMPGQTEGFCTATGCVDDLSVCPEGWSCFDLSMFVADGPSFCLAP